MNIKVIRQIRTYGYEWIRKMIHPHLKPNSYWKDKPISEHSVYVIQVIKIYYPILVQCKIMFLNIIMFYNLTESQLHS